MDISHVEPRLLNLGLTQEQVNELKAAAAKLPPGFEDGTLIDIPRFPGLTQHQSEIFAVRLLDRLAVELGIPVEDPDLYDELGYPSLEELILIAEQHERMMQAKEHERV